MRDHCQASHGCVTIGKLLSCGSLGRCDTFLGLRCVLRSSRMEPPRITPGASSPWGRRQCGVAVLHRNRRGQERGRCNTYGCRWQRRAPVRPRTASSRRHGLARAALHHRRMRSRGRLIWSEHAGAMVRLAAPCVRRSRGHGASPTRAKKSQIHESPATPPDDHGRGRRCGRAGARRCRLQQQ